MSSRLRQRDVWRLSDDRVIGGYSDSSAHLIRPSLLAEPDEVVQDTTTLSDENSMLMTEEEEVLEDSMMTETNATTKRPFIRWYGNLDTTIGLESKVQRSGFAALRSPTFLGGANLRGAYTALEITCRTDGRVYTINLQVDTSLPEDMFQGHIDVPATQPGRWDRLYLPFSEFSFMGTLQAADSKSSQQRRQQKGSSNERTREEEDLQQESDEINMRRKKQMQDEFRRRMAQRRSLEIGASQDVSATLDGKVCIQSIGFTLMDGQDGAFRFDLANVRAVNFFQDKVWEGPPE